MRAKLEETESVTLINPDAVVCEVNKSENVGQSAFFARTGSRTKSSYHHFKTRASLSVEIRFQNVQGWRRSRRWAFRNICEK
jgi:hypothetical protein